MKCHHGIIAKKKKAKNVRIRTMEALKKSFMVMMPNANQIKVGKDSYGNTMSHSVKIKVKKDAIGSNPKVTAS